MLNDMLLIVDIVLIPINYQVMRNIEKDPVPEKADEIKHTDCIDIVKDNSCKIGKHI